MAFQTPISIATALERIQRHEYVLPAIQREFVWSADQICRLFDSLMLGYPIGSFLFWKVDSERVGDYAYYGFLRDYHQRDQFHLPRLDVPDRVSLTAILDGQQRLTSLYIGLRGSHAEKLPRRWVALDESYPTRFLYLNVATLAEENEMRMEYDFRFLTPKRAQDETQCSETVHWFKVRDVSRFEDATDIFEYIQQYELATNRTAFKTLARLHSVVTSEPIINYFEETAQDLDKVLNIFIRVNSGGTVLSYSDLLLSIATAQWKEIDAREAVHQLVDDLNDVGQGFGFNKDIVLKSGLMLADIPSVAFRVTNFNAANMKKLEENWSRISLALRLSVRLLADFGFSDRTLTAHSVLIPLAYYLHHRGADDRYLNANAFAEDRERIRGWVIRSLVKPGVWGSGLDTLLLSLRSAIRETDAMEFPLESVESAMAGRGKSLRFDEDEIRDLLEMSYGDRRIFTVLSLLYPGMDFRHEFHVDHIFPRNLMTRRRLLAAGIDPIDLDRTRYRMDRLANLQLLEGPTNVAKTDKLPMEWLREQFPDDTARDYYRARHDLGDIPESINGFDTFYQGRRNRIAGLLRDLLGVIQAESVPAPDHIG